MHASPMYLFTMYSFYYLYIKKADVYKSHHETSKRILPHYICDNVKVGLAYFNSNNDKNSW